MTLLIQILACILVADLLSGLFHWLEDAYGHEDLPVLGALVTRRNNLHHQDPSAFTHKSWWGNSWLLILIATGIGLVAFALGLFTWQVALVLAIGANGNQLHKWAHRSRRHNGPVVGLLMDLRLIPSQRHHGRHHSGAENGAYCVITPWLNPLLDRLGLWTGLERAVERVCGARRRDPRMGALPAGEWPRARRGRRAA